MSSPDETKKQCKLTGSQTLGAGFHPSASWVPSRLMVSQSTNLYPMDFGGAYQIYYLTYKSLSATKEFIHQKRLFHRSGNQGMGSEALSHTEAL